MSGGRPRRRCALSVLGIVLLAGGSLAAEPASPGTGLQPQPLPPALARQLRERQPLRYDQPAEAQEHFVRKRVPAGEGAIPVERYLSALEHMAKMPQYSTARKNVLPSRAELGQRGVQYAVDASALGAWDPLGPGNVGGRTRFLVIHPQEPRIMYAGGGAGGVWKTVDGGESWAPLADFLPNLAVNTLVMDPKNPNVLFAGTGEGYFNLDQVRGAGIFRSADGGASWQHLAGTRNASFHFVNDLVISPKVSSRIYAATGTGVWRSTNNGSTWTRILNPQVNGGCLDLAIRTDQATDFLFASCGTFAQATVYRSIKAEANGSWAMVLKDPGMGRTSLAIAPSNQKIVYALASSLAAGPYQHGLHAVFRSDAAGTAGTWKAQVRNSSPKPLNNLLLTNPLLALCMGEVSFSNQGWYDNVIAVDPKDPQRVWAGGIDLFRSDDGGRNWGLASYWWGSYVGSPPSYAHADQHAIVFHPAYNGTTNKTMFVGNDGGIFQTLNARVATARTPAAACNAAATPFVWKNLNNGYGITQFYHGVAYLDGSAYLGGTQDNGTIVGDDFLGPDGWTGVLGGDGGYVAVDPQDSNVLYAENPGLSIQKSFDGGETWRPAMDGIAEDPENFPFITPFAMAPDDPEVLWTGAFSLWRTMDGAASWTQASSPVAGDETSIVSAIGIDPADSEHVLVGTSRGFIHRNTAALSSTGGTDWPFSQPRDGYISSIAIDEAEPTIAYATYATFGGNHVWKTTDGGVTWSAIDGVGAGRLPDVPVHSVAIDPYTFTTLFVGTDVGVFVTVNGGQTWMVENTGFANVNTETLQVLLNEEEQEFYLYAFTHGRGAWRVRLD